MDKKLSEFIKKRRGDMSLRDFARTCGDVSYSTIDVLEKGVDYRTGKPVRPTVEILQKVAAGLVVPAYYLCGLAAGENPPMIDNMTAQQKDLLTAFAALDPEGQENVLRAVRFEQFRMAENNSSAEKKKGTA